eukprot:3120068-Rhodomonas_salina.1
MFQRRGSEGHVKSGAQQFSIEIIPHQVVILALETHDQKPRASPSETACCLPSNELEDRPLQSLTFPKAWLGYVVRCAPLWGMQ